MKKQPEKKECECQSVLAEKIKENAVKTSKFKNFKIIKSKWEHESFFPKVRVYFNYVIQYEFEKVNGRTSTPKWEHVSIFPTYCPFCGKKYPTTK